MSKIQELFPHCIITNEKIDWVGCINGNYGKGQYVDGWTDELMLDGEFNIEELSALVEWMKS